MRPGERDNELVFEGSFEARIAAQLLADAGQSDLIRNIEPQIRWAYMGRRHFRKTLPLILSGGITENTQYYCGPPDSLQVLDTLVDAAKVPSPHRPPRNMREYMGERLGEYAMKVRALIEADWDTPTFYPWDDGNGMEPV